MLVEVSVVSRQKVRLKGTTLFFRTCSAYADPQCCREVTLLLHSCWFDSVPFQQHFGGTFLTSGGKKQSETRPTNSPQAVNVVLSWFCINSLCCSNLCLSVVWSALGYEFFIKAFLSKKLPQSELELMVVWQKGTMTYRLLSNNEVRRNRSPGWGRGEPAYCQHQYEWLPQREHPQDPGVPRGWLWCT